MQTALQYLKARINNAIYIFNQAKDDINGDKHKGLIDACNMILEWIEEMEETPWKEMKRYK